MGHLILGPGPVNCLLHNTQCSGKNPIPNKPLTSFWWIYFSHRVITEVTKKSDTSDKLVHVPCWSGRWLARCIWRCRWRRHFCPQSWCWNWAVGRWEEMMKWKWQERTGINIRCVAGKTQWCMPPVTRSNFVFHSSVSHEHYTNIHPYHFIFLPLCMQMQLKLII